MLGVFKQLSSLSRLLGEKLPFALPYSALIILVSHYRCCIAIFITGLRHSYAEGCCRDEDNPNEEVFHFDAPYVSPLVSGMESS